MTYCINFINLLYLNCNKRYSDTMVKRFATRLLLIVLLASSTTISLFSQEQERDSPTFAQRLFFGGDFGLTAGTITDIKLAPLIGIWITPRLAVAAGPEYR